MRKKGKSKGEMLRKDFRVKGKISSKVGRVVDELHWQRRNKHFCFHGSVIERTYADDLHPRILVKTKAHAFLCVGLIIASVIIFCMFLL
jgi:hypothetical protein